MERFDWYVGLPPSSDAHVVARATAIREAVAALEPDGLFLGFMRWPNFWEAWMPHHTRQDFPEYSFDQGTLERFTRETGLGLPSHDPAKAARWIETNARDIWTDWKCGVVEGVIRQVSAAGRGVKPDLPIMLNTVPFGASDYDRALEKVYGQRIEALAEVIDVFEVMAYHQVLKRSVAWIAEIGKEIKARSKRKTICTLQAAPLYCAGIHAPADRSPSLPIEEFERAVNAVVDTAEIDGIALFSWSDFLHQVFDKRQNRWIDAVRAAVERRTSRQADLL
jgi:hypothetical protein